MNDAGRVKSARLVAVAVFLAVVSPAIGSETLRSFHRVLRDDVGGVRLSASFPVANVAVRSGPGGSWTEARIPGLPSPERMCLASTS